MIKFISLTVALITLSINYSYASSTSTSTATAGGQSCSGLACLFTSTSTSTSTVTDTRSTVLKNLIRTAVPLPNLLVLDDKVLYSKGSSGTEKYFYQVDLSLIPFDDNDIKGGGTRNDIFTNALGQRMIGIDFVDYNIDRKTHIDFMPAAYNESEIRSLLESDEIELVFTDDGRLYVILSNGLTYRSYFENFIETDNSNNAGSTSIEVVEGLNSLFDMVMKLTYKDGTSQLMHLSLPTALDSIQKEIVYVDREVEVPVEKIVYQDRVVEKIVEKIVEVPVEKIVYAYETPPVGEPFTLENQSMLFQDHIYKTETGAFIIITGFYETNRMGCVGCNDLDWQFLPLPDKIPDPNSIDSERGTHYHFNDGTGTIAYAKYL